MRAAAILLAALGASGCEAALTEPATGVARVCFLQSGGEVKECHDEATSSNLDMSLYDVRVRCWELTDGTLVNCSVLRAPDAAHYDILEAAKHTRVPPLVVAGKPVEGFVVLVSRVQFVEHR